jgi:hypothetical protein
MGKYNRLLIFDTVFEINASVFFDPQTSVRVFALPTGMIYAYSFVMS